MFSHGLPTETDVDGVAVSFIRLQNTYNLTASDVASGNILGIEVEPLTGIYTALLKRCTLLIILHARERERERERERVPKRQSTIDIPEKLATYGTQDEEEHNNNMCWTPLCASKHKYSKLDKNPPTNWSIFC
jgi:hypothetical protein